MNILWLVNNSFDTDFSSSSYNGTWISTYLSILRFNKYFKLTVVFPSVSNNFNTFKKDNINFIELPLSCFGLYKNLDLYIDFKKFDLLHVHGTEQPRNYFFIRKAQILTCVSLQGILIKITSSLSQGYPTKKNRNYTIPYKLKFCLLLNKLLTTIYYYIRSFFEKMIICNSSFIFGRTSFDYYFIKHTYSKLNYFYLPEYIRNIGLDNTDLCINKKFIFISSLSYSVKNAFILIDIIYLTIKDIPDIHFVVAGPLNDKKVFGLNISYIILFKQLVTKLKLEKHFTFTGSLNPDLYSCYLRKCFFYLCTSTCENSSNSILEALSCAKPVIASNVGGIKDFKKANLGILLTNNYSSISFSQNIIKLYNDEHLRNKLVSKNIKNYENFVRLTANQFPRYLSNIYQNYIYG